MRVVVVRWREELFDGLHCGCELALFVFGEFLEHAADFLNGAGLERSELATAFLH